MKKHRYKLYDKSFKDAVVAEYIKTKNKSEIIKKYRLYASTIDYWLVSAGIKNIKTKKTQATLKRKNSCKKYSDETKKRVLKEYYKKGLRRDIAERLDIPEGTINSWIRRDKWEKRVKGKM